MRWDVELVLKWRFERAKQYQLKKNNIQICMTFEQFCSLWTPYRIQVIEAKIDEGFKSVNRYFSGKNTTRPVLGWKSREHKHSNVMLVSDAIIDRADWQMAKFKIRKGDKHKPESLVKMRKPRSAAAKLNMKKSEETRKKMSKPKSPATKAKMAAAKKKYWEEKRKEKKQ